MQQQLEQALAKVHTALTAHGWSLILSEDESDDDLGEILYNREYGGDAILQTDGDGRWGAGPGLQVPLKTITVTATEYVDDTDYWWHVGVIHTHEERGYMLYTDKGLARQLSELCGVELHFTEQGMQDNYYMSME